MKPLARKTIALAVAVALLHGALPTAVLAGVAKAVAPEKAVGVRSEDAIKQMRQWGVFTEGDVLQTYLFDDKGLTPLGRALYLSLADRYNPNDEVAGMKPVFDRLRENGPYDARRAGNVSRAYKMFQEKFGKIDQAEGGSLEEQFLRGAQREALMSGAAVNEQPKAEDLTQVRTKDGYEFWDAKGLVYRINKKNATTKSRELQKYQRLYNLSRPPQVPFIPETGQYNFEMFDYSYWRMKNQYDDLVEGLRRDRMIAMAELLGTANQYREDMWFTDKRLEADLIALAKAKSYRHRGKDYNVFDLVEARFETRRRYLEGSLKGVERYHKDMLSLKKELKETPVVTDAQVQTQVLDEQGSMRFLTLSVLETQMFYVKNMLERLDPASSDSEQVMKALEESDLAPNVKADYKVQALKMVARLKALRGILERTRDLLEASDYAASLDMANAALSSSQRELGEISSDYAMFVEIPSVSHMARQQADVSWLNFGAKAVRGVYRGLRSGSEYTRAIQAMQDNHAKLMDVAGLIASGKMAEARKKVIDMNPGATKLSMEASLGADSGRITDAMRLAASLKVNRDRIGTVFETNKWLDTAGGFISWTTSLALAAPTARWALNGAAGKLSKLTDFEVSANANALQKLGAWTVRRGAIGFSETFRHTAARLGTLEPSGAWVQSQANTSVGRFLVASKIRMANVAVRQLSFTAFSGGISGVFTMGKHLWDQAGLKVGDYEVLKPGHSMFNEDFEGAVDALWTGTKGGIWWANGSLAPTGAFSWVPTAALGYVGLPSTVFRGTMAAGAMEVLGTRGVAGSTMMGLKYGMLKGVTGLSRLFGWAESTGLAGGALTRTSAALAAKAGSLAAASEVGAVAVPGLLEKMGALGKTQFAENMAAKGTLGRVGASALGMAGTSGAFTLGMADNVAKFFVFSQFTGWVGRQYGYGYYGAPVVGSVGSYAGEEDVERRIKGANAVSQKWLESPAWLIIPTYAAHQARDAAMYMRAQQGMEQYDRKGLTHEYANAKEGARLRFVEKPKVPWSQIIFETSFKSDTAGDFWLVTNEARRAGIRKELVRSLGGDKATAADINPMEFYRASKLGDGDKFINLKANDEFRLIAHQDFVEALLADPVRAKSVLDAKLGTTVEKFGRVTPEIQKDVAVALYSSELQAGKPMPAQLQGRVGEILKPYLEANESVKPYAKGFVEALKGAPTTEGFKTVLDGVRDQVVEWKKGGQPYMEFVTKLRQDAAALKTEGKISAPEHEVLVKMYDYVESIERRFNSFNNVEKTQSLAAETLGSLRTEFAGRPGPTKIIERFGSALDQWASGHGRTDAVDGPRSDGSFKKMISGLDRELESVKPTLSPSEFTAMKSAVTDMGASPWVLHDSKGTALAGWRPVQFEGFMNSLTAVAEQGRGGEPVRIFQLLKTGGGKTMLTFEGLLPLAEADAANHGMKTMFLTVQSNLEAQARMEFIAFKKIGSKLDFDTYEGFKTKIAEGKTKGHNALRDYWILGDEMDGAALQPALTIGEVSGRVSKLNPVYKRAEEIDADLGSRVERVQSGQAGKAQTEALRAGNTLARLEGPQGEALRTEGIRMEGAARDLVEARGPQARRLAEAELRQSALRMETQLQTLPASQIKEAVSQNLGRLKTLLSEPSMDAAGRQVMAGDLEAGFARQQNLLKLTGSQQGLTRLGVEARKSVTALETRISRLERDASAAESSKSPGAPERAQAMREEVSLLRRELTAVQRFDVVDPGLKLANLQEKIAGAEAGESAQAAKLPGWKSTASQIEQTLPAERKAASASHVEALRKIYETGREINKVDAQLIAAKSEGRSPQELQTRRAALEADYATYKSAAGRYKAELAADGARLALTPAEARVRLNSAADDIVAEVREAKPGWEDRATRLLNQRRSMMTAFAGDENPVYTVFRDMKEDARSFAMNERLRSPDAAVYEPARKTILGRVDGQSLSSLILSPKLPLFKLVKQVMRGEPVDVNLDAVGLTRVHAAKLLKAISQDPTMPVHQRDDLFWNVAPSLLWPNGISGKRSSWVRTELLRQLHGFYEDAAGIRLDGRANVINVVHNGQWFESMDNETRRFWELEYGVDLTLPYTHQSISTIKDITTDKKARFISFSGTAGDKLREHFKDNKIQIVGAGSKAPEVVELDAVTGGGGRFKRIGQALADVNSARGEVVVRTLDKAPEAVRKAVESKLGGPLKDPAVLRLADFEGAPREWLSSLRQVQGDADHVLLRQGDVRPPEAKAAIDAYLATKNVAGKDAVVRISEVQSEAAQSWLRGLRANQKDTGLVVLSVSDTRVLRTVKEYLKRSGIKPDEIAMVFSDTEYLRNNVPEANVKKQMNLEALDQGKARVLILDTRVGGRGLDLNFKGERNSLDPKAFRGYTNFEMLIVDPDKMSSVHLLQAEGRIDVDRVHMAADRKFSLVMDVKAVQGEGIFREMIKSDAFFQQMRTDPAFQKFTLERKIAEPDWAAYHEFVREHPEQAAKYQEVVKSYLEKQQSGVEMNQLKSSSVSTDSPMTTGRFPGIEGMR